MFSQTERSLLIRLITKQIVSQGNSIQHQLLVKLRTKVENGGELLTMSAMRQVLDMIGEADSHHHRWLLYETDITVLVDALNALHIQHAIPRKDLADARQFGKHYRSRCV